MRSLRPHRSGLRKDQRLTVAKMDNKNPEIDDKTLFASKTQNYLDKLISIGGGLIAVWSFTIWYTINWEYMPEWLPLPGLPLMDIIGCFGPILFLISLIPVLLIFVLGLFGNLILLVDRILSLNLLKVIHLTIGLTILGSAALPWMFHDDIEKMALNQAIRRYDVVIDAIETYRSDYGRYPANLNVLVPKYLPELPGRYMKFGKILTYESTASLEYDHAPFIFELYGLYFGIHGQTLKYCPVTVDPCFEKVGHLTPERINARWIWVYSSAF